MSVLTSSVLLLLVVTTVLAQSEAQQWASKLGADFVTLRDEVMHVGDITKMFDDSEYREESINAKDNFEQFKSELEALFADKDQIVARLAERVASAWTAASDDEGCQPLYADGNDLSLTPSPELGGAKVDFDQSAVLVAPQAEPTQKELCFSRELDAVFRENDPGRMLPWQYFGSQSGYHRQYPASARSSGYDPRVRPWYTGASSGAKAVVLVLDTSGSMLEKNRLDLMKEAAVAVLDSLTVIDFVNVVSFGTSASGPSCASDNMLRATEANVAYLKDFISKLRASGKTNFYEAFDVAFDMYENYKLDIENGEKGGACRDAFLFLTDGQPSNSQDHNELIQRRNSAHNVHIFTYALGASATIQDDIACNNAGTFTAIADGGNLRTKMSSYYQLFSLTADDKSTFWTAPYFDASGLGMMVTGARIVFDPAEETNVALGVVGHDVRLTQFTELVEAFNRGDSYAFLVDKRGNAIMHPRMSALAESTAAPVYEDIALLENQEDSAEFLAQVRAKMLAGESGTHVMTVNRLQDRGESAYEGLRTQPLRVVYWWAPVGPFIFGYAQAESDTTDLYLKSIDPATVPTSYYHALELYDDALATAAGASRLGALDEKYPNQLVTFNTSTFYLAPRTFGVRNSESPALQLVRTETSEDVTAIHNFVNKEEGNADLRDRIADMVRRLSALDQFWVGVEKVNDAIGWLYLGTPDGIHRRYPGGNQQAPGYDPTLRPWYKRANTFLNNLVISTPYFDASGLGRVVTLAHTVPRRAKDLTIGGVIGLDFTYPKFHEMVREESPCAADDSKECLLIDSSGYVIYHKSFITKRDQENTENEFIASIDEALAQSLITAKFLNEQRYTDFRTQQDCVSYIADASTLDRSTLTLNVQNDCTRGEAAVTRVSLNGSATNVYAIVLTGWRTNACLKFDLPGCVKLEAPGPCDKKKLSTTKQFDAGAVQCKEVAQITDEQLETIRIADPNGGSCHGLKSGAIAGIVIGTILFLACCILLIVVLIRRN